MNNFAACLIVFALFSISSDWQPSSNIMVEAGRLISFSNCMGVECRFSHCPPNCREELKSKIRRCCKKDGHNKKAGTVSHYFCRVGNELSW
ncbi:hypothetical protein MTO96_040406 [Rhipicephalus appendiculatus]